MGMHSLFLSLKAIERACKEERSNDSPNEKALHSKKKDTKQSGTNTMARVPKKAHAKKHCDLFKKHGSACTMHNIRCCCHWFENDGMKKSDFCAAKKGGMKPTPTKQSFTQLSEKLDKLEKVTKKTDTKKRKHCRSNRDSYSDK
jgi:hypothetical protein